MPWFPPQADPMTRTIVHDMRLPIALMALVVGASLGLGGVQMQTLLDNPSPVPTPWGSRRRRAWARRSPSTPAASGSPP